MRCVILVFVGSNDMKHVVCKNCVGYVKCFTVRCAYQRVLYMVSAILLMLIMGEDAQAVGDRAVKPKKFYAALDYTPAFSKVRDFYISGDKRSVFVMPYPKIKGQDVKAQGGGVDWSSPNPNVEFESNALMSWEGSLGYKIKGGRIEVEVGHEKFRARVSHDSGGEIHDAAVYVFMPPRALPYFVLSDPTERLASELASVKEEEILAFATGLAARRPDIDRKVCYRAAFGRDNESSSSSVNAACRNSKNGRDVGGLYAFLKRAIGEYSMWTDLGDREMGRGGRILNVKDMVGYVKELTTEDKEALAGILAMTMGYGRVVEISSIAATSVILNACYDRYVRMMQGVSWYACLGVGSNFVEVVDKHITHKFAYRLKAGLSYQILSGVSAFVGGFYHHVIGDGIYDELPVRRIGKDFRKADRNQYEAVANFDMSYMGTEFGIRWAF
ncbi:surface antigen family protein [Anaplasma phagocytophilum str. CRT53-1]|uniref:Surface antigen family protein n=1 Tax=Anaplasma phagocytophilum str. CRT53-1 TaxID=1359157 RepID=A0A0F3PUL9_ANAPH|nr:P44/Msp2 family outer membrane protein [Anaplasma phagocytophilum]KJV83898.1 surface antigen family protein [Anaplasma phagocytophilum str. CRT53-1]KJV83953.1 surface antigen family protein [Anaplasma phagocytophilum str. CRT53-1]